MFPRPFQYFEARHLADVLQFFVMSWVILGIPGIPAIFGIRFLLRKLKIYRLGFYRRMVFRPILLSVSMAGLIFGLVTGYFEAWTQRDSYKPEYKDRWYDALGIFGVPGDAMANSYGGDWQDDEAWDYRSDISIWNGLFWMTVTMAAAVCIYGRDRYCMNGVAMKFTPASA